MIFHRSFKSINIVMIVTEKNYVHNHFILLRLSPENIYIYACAIYVFECAAIVLSGKILFYWVCVRAKRQSALNEIRDTL